MSKTVQRVQTGVRIEERLLKVLKALAEQLDLSLGDLLEGMALHCIEGKVPFSKDTLRKIEKLKDVYDLDLTAEDSHQLDERGRDDFSGADAITIARHGSFELDMTPEEALPLFTAPGEKLWIPSWDPVVFNGDGYEKGTVFVTSNHGHTAYWLVTDYDTDAKRAQYVRVTPEANTGTVDVSITRNEKGGAIVTVAYQLTGLSPAGNADLQESFSESRYADMMEEWRNMIIGSREQIDDHFGS